MRSEFQPEFRGNDNVVGNTQQFDQAGSNLFADAYADSKVVTPARSLNPCDIVFASDAAKALDEDRRPEATKLLQACHDQSSGIFSDSPDYQKFAESTAALEIKGKGLDLTLKYGFGRLSAFYFKGAEIK